MTKIISSIFFLFSVITLTASGVFACSCETMPDIPIERQVKDAYTKSSSVFVGKVVQVNKLNDYSVLVKFDVEKSWGKTFQKKISISTASHSAMCGYEFQVGKKYLVYASGENNKLSTTICTRTASVVSNKDVVVLNKIKKPKIKSSPK